MRLSECKNINDLAACLGYSPKSLAYVVYGIPDAVRYKTFQIPKKNGGTRKINAPCAKILRLQRKIYDEILLEISDFEVKHKIIFAPSAHGFVRGRSTFTNAAAHPRSKYIINLDLSDFFETINFGRVKGVLENNPYFKLHPEISKVIAHACCYKGVLPQGAPTSPVISNLVGRILDRNLKAFSKRNRLKYTRYADDITFSTRMVRLPRAVAVRGFFRRHKWRPGRELRARIKKLGFRINQTKFRVQITGSKQEITGLNVTDKPTVPLIYRKKLRAQIEKYLKTGSYFDQKASSGSAALLTSPEALIGKYSYVYQIYKYRNQKYNKEISATFLSMGQKLFLAAHFFHREDPLVFTEGKTDVIYLKYAIKSLKYKGFFKDLDVKLFRYTKIKASALKFQEGFQGQFEAIGALKKFRDMHSISFKSPIIFVIDNDSAAKAFNSQQRNLAKPDIPKRLSPLCTKLFEGVYVVLTPLNGRKEACIEDLFPKSVLETTVNGKHFDPNKKDKDETKVGKSVFATEVVEKQWKSISFDEFESLLSAINEAVQDFAKS